MLPSWCAVTSRSPEGTPGLRVIIVVDDVGSLPLASDRQAKHHQRLDVAAKPLPAG